MFFGLFVFFPSHHMYNNKIVTNYLIIWFDSFSLKSWHLFVFFFNAKNMDQPEWPNLFKMTYFWPGPFWPTTQMTQSKPDLTGPFAMSIHMQDPPYKILIQDYEKIKLIISVIKLPSCELIYLYIYIYIFFEIITDRYIFYFWNY